MSTIPFNSNKFIPVLLQILYDFLISFKEINGSLLLSKWHSIDYKLDDLAGPNFVRTEGPDDDILNNFLILLKLLPFGRCRFNTSVENFIVFGVNMKNKVLNQPNLGLILYFVGSRYRASWFDTERQFLSVHNRCCHSCELDYQILYWFGNANLTGKALFKMCCIFFIWNAFFLDAGRFLISSNYGLVL